MITSLRDLVTSYIELRLIEIHEYESQSEWEQFYKELRTEIANELNPLVSRYDPASAFDLDQLFVVSDGYFMPNYEYLGL